MFTLTLSMQIIVRKQFSVVAALFTAQLCFTSFAASLGLNIANKNFNSIFSHNLNLYSNRESADASRGKKKVKLNFSAVPALKNALKILLVFLFFLPQNRS